MLKGGSKCVTFIAASAAAFVLVHGPGEAQASLGGLTSPGVPLVDAGYTHY
jgi:hypothetical protein